MAFRFEALKIRGVFLITPQAFEDARGYFMETYRRELFEAEGICDEFVQDNESSSTRGVLRGLHFQRKHTQGKLVRVTSGCVYDVAVDIRPGSETFGKYVAATLDAENKQMLYIPAGFAHGMLVLSDAATFAYKCTDIYDPGSEGGIPWNDPDIGIQWPALDCPYKTSERDSRHPDFRVQSFDWANKYL